MKSLQSSQLWSLLGGTWDSFLAHNVPRLGAALAFYTMLSLAPLLVVVIAVAGWAFGREAAVGQLVWQIQDLTGYEGAQAVKSLLTAAHKPATGSIAAVLGILTLFVGASSAIAELRDALNIIWDVPPKESGGMVQSVLAILKDRTLAFAMVLGIGFLLLVSLAINAALAALGNYFEAYLPANVWILQSANFVISFFVVTLLFTLIYKVLPDIYITWTDVALGAAITSLLFTVGKMLLSIYLGKAAFVSTYGAAGSLVVLLLWVYYSAQIFFLGAEFTHIYAERYGSRPSRAALHKVEVISRIPDVPATS
ncbi:MAG: YihY/virulence factor BrkB family protein [Bryobacteraceae bacterium]